MKNAPLTPTDYLLIGLVAICLITLFGYIIYRAATGHLRDDFMTPQEAANYYLRGQTPERIQNNPPHEKKGLVIFFAGIILMSLMYWIFSSIYH